MLALAALPRAALAQSGLAQVISKSQAEGVKKLVLVAVERGISSLPPSTGQAYSYDWNPEIETFERSGFAGPVSFRTPATIGPGHLSVRVASSFFSLSKHYDPIDYEFTDTSSKAKYYGRIGLEPRASVGIISTALTYGWSDSLEFNLNLPIVIADVSATQTFACACSEAVTRSYAPGIQSLAALDQGLAGGSLTLKKQPLQRMLLSDQELARQGLSKSQSASFSSGTSAGLGRAGLGVKWVLLTSRLVDVAFVPDLLLPSPSEDAYAGSDTFAVVPRMVAMGPGEGRYKLHLEAGYDYDFDVAELRRFEWRAGASAAFKSVTIDAGVAGATYAAETKWTSQSGTIPLMPGNPQLTANVDYRALGNANSGGGTTVDFLAGTRIEVVDGAMITGSVSVALDDSGLRADAVGTLAFEYYF